MSDWESALSPEQLSGIRNHIMYELRMLRWACDRRLDYDYCGSDPYLGSALLDSFLIHARSLYAFFQSPKYPNDVCVRQFLSDWRPSGLETVSSSISDINKCRGHISYERLELDSTVEWQMREIRDELDSAFEQLRAVLPPEEQPHWVPG